MFKVFHPNLALLILSSPLLLLYSLFFIIASRFIDYIAVRGAWTGELALLVC